jgi:hypothetical protein
MQLHCVAAWLSGYLQSSVPQSSSAEHCTPGSSVPRHVGCWYEHSMSPGMTLTSCTAAPFAQYMRTRSALPMACTQQPAGDVKLVYGYASETSCIDFKKSNFYVMLTLTTGPACNSCPGSQNPSPLLRNLLQPSAKRTSTLEIGVAC